MSNIYKTFTLSFLTASTLFGQVQCFEGNEYPETWGWDVVQLYCNPNLSLEDGKFVVRVDLCPPHPPPGGQSAAYDRPIAEFIGKDKFFLEFRLVTSAPRNENLWGGGAMLAAGSFGPVSYAFSITEDQVELVRDNRLPIVLVDIEPGISHAIRIELYDDDLYILYIDGEPVDSGIPEGNYPSFSPSITWVTRAIWVKNETRWDYIRYGRIAEDGSGDFDSDNDIDLRDLYYFVECLDNSGPLAGSGPGCRWADLDSDMDTDLRDFSKLQNSYTGQP